MPTTAIKREYLELAEERLIVAEVQVEDGFGEVLDHEEHLHETVEVADYQKPKSYCWKGFQGPRRCSWPRTKVSPKAVPKCLPASCRTYN